MKPLLAIALMAWSAAYAQNVSPAPQTAPPANQALPATPDTNAPTQVVPEVAPPAGAGFVPDQSWVGRFVYSNDGKSLGTIAGVNTLGPLIDIYFDMGGFLGIGTTRKHFAAELVRDLKSDRIILSLTKEQADNLPTEK
jgi:hypothetical protein